MFKSMFKVIFIWIQTVLLMQIFVFWTIDRVNKKKQNLLFKLQICTQILRYIYFYMKIDLIEVLIDKIFEKPDIYDRYATIEISDQC